MRPRFALPTAAVAAALALAGCASTTSGTGSTGKTPGGGATTPSTPTSQHVGGGSSSPTSPESSTATSSTGAPDGKVGLALAMQQAVQDVKTAQISLTVEGTGQSITGKGSEELSNGKLVALDITEHVSTISLRLLIVGGKAYAKLPSTLNPTGKPWLLLSTHSSDPTIAELAKTLAQTQSQASVSNVNTFVRAAKSVTEKGKTTVNGQPATHYSVVVDVTKLPTSMTSGQSLSQYGITTIPVELYLDSQNRPVEVTENIKVSGQSINTKITIGKYNAPVHITAPPASQIGTS